jgi:hypothetical protein
MHVVLGIVGGVPVDDDSNVVGVDAAGGDIGGDEDLHATTTDGVDGSLSLWL